MTIIEKEFNVTGICVPTKHYMVDTSKKILRILPLIERGKYFTINRPRQYGKTTTLLFIEKELLKRSDYLCISLSFEGIGDKVFETESSFCQVFIRILANSVKDQDIETSKWLRSRSETTVSFELLSETITDLVLRVSRKIVIMIDEVDKSSNNQLFVSFLGMLRDKYLKQHSGKDQTFYSIVLVGVHDVKSLKLKMASDFTGKLNSPWNIAADFNIDMSFNAGEIANMLTVYSHDKKIEMDIQAIAEKLYFYTSGYPFLVSKMCKIIDEEILPDKNENKWNIDYVDIAYKSITYPAYSTTIFDDLFKNLENNPLLFDLVYKVAVDGEKFALDINNPILNLGILYGIFCNSGDSLKIHNHIFNTRICNYLTSKLETSKSGITEYSYKEDFVDENNQLNMKLVLQKFQKFYKEQFSRKDQKFIEREGRLLFLAFLKPIINGDGYDFKEVTISKENRMDIVVTFQNQRFVIEVKIWYGEEYHQRGLKQLSNYLDTYSQKEGYLLIFDFNIGKQYHEEMIQYADKQIFAVWV